MIEIPVGRLAAMRVLVALLSCHLATVLPGTLAVLPEPSEKLWTAGCGRHPTVADPTRAVSPVPPQGDIAVNDSLVLVLLMSRTAARICDELNNTISLVVNETDTPVNELEESELETLLKGKTPGPSQQMEDVLTKAITRMSRIGLFLELARNDTVDYTGKITELERKVIEIVCQMYQLMKVIKVEVTSNVTRDLVTSKYRDGLDTLGRHKRNLLITRIAKAILCTFGDRLQSLPQMQQMAPLKN
ncbi:uncharacterized protein [Haliotis cracherodii]|uniref:uncharacterized protein n=1 Tax=Haliotis cracherodii TaxID=6455 RepID=UPI0039EA16BC